MKTSESLKAFAPAFLKAQGLRDQIKESAAIKPLFGRKRKTKTETKEWSFFRRIAFGATDCWHWVGNRNTLGYGVMPTGGLAHRYACELFHGVLPDGMVVMHSCDNPSCVNPDHLSIGTQADNIRDMERKGRANHSKVRGENNPKAKLTYASAEQMRQSGKTAKQLADMHGIGLSTAYRVLNGVSWT